MAWGGRPGRTPGSPVSPGIELTSTYVQPGDIDPDLPLYGRYANATWAALEEVIGGLEGSPEGAVAFASGMAASAALFSLVPRDGRARCRERCARVRVSDGKGWGCWAEVNPASEEWDLPRDRAG